MGRCPVRSIFPEALDMLRQKQHLLGYVRVVKLEATTDWSCSFMSDKIMPLTEAVEGYDLFDKMKVQKGKQLRTHDRCTSLTCNSGI